jgi:hypothetical protein
MLTISKPLSASQARNYHEREFASEKNRTIGAATSRDSANGVDIAAEAKEYAKSPESMLVASPDSRSRMEINERIQADLFRGMNAPAPADG